MKSNYDVVVVGGGPAGSMAAWEAAKGGASVCMLEKDRDIGYPVRCGEAASDLGLRQFVEPIDIKIKQNENIPFGITLQVHGKKIMV